MAYRPPVERLVLAGLVLALAVLALAYLRVPGNNPPAMYRDEAGIALDADLVAHTGRDSSGALLPLYFRSFGDYKSAPYIYLLGAVFSVTGPHETVAREVSAVLGVLGVALLGVLGRRLTGSTAVGLATALLAATTPWLFEVSRLVFEVALLPPLLAVLLLLVHGGGSRDRWSSGRCVAVGVTIAAIAYAYAGGRALAPVLAGALLVTSRGPRLRSVLASLAAAAVALLPMAAFAVKHPSALLVRFSHVRGDEGAGGPLPVRILLQWLQELNLLRWVASGDRNLRHHVHGGGGSLLAAGVLLAGLGIVVLVRRGGWDPFWSFTVLALVGSAVPAAISDVRLHALRSVGIPVLLVVLAVPALAQLTSSGRGRAVLVATATVGLVQLVVFAAAWQQQGPRRTAAFHAGLRPVLHAALATGRPVVVGRDDPDALGGTAWLAHVEHVPVRLLNGSEPAPPGSVLVAVERTCPGCTSIADADIFHALVVPGG
jgi:4-amino-4-deoxy-L-arabinose transferase-like glycosyltransferase